MRRLRIGVSSAFMYPDASRSVFWPKTLCYVEADLARWIASLPGWEPILIPDLPPGKLDFMLQSLDAVVFQGGTDLAPLTYGSGPNPWPGDPLRDAYEWRLLESALARKLPVLGICRGAQLLNVFFGGKHIPDIPSHLNTAVVHRNGEAYDQTLHAIEFTPGGFFELAYRNDPSRLVNSIHHQGIGAAGPALRVEAICPGDGLIEAISWTEDRPGRVIGVQWHPEFSEQAPLPVLNASSLLMAWQHAW